MIFLVDPDLPNNPVNIFCFEGLLAARFRFAPGEEGRTAFLDLHYSRKDLARIHDILRFASAKGEEPKVYIYKEDGKRKVAVYLRFRTTWVRARILLPKAERERRANSQDREVCVQFFSSSVVRGDWAEFQQLFQKREYFMLSLKERQALQTELALGHFEEGPPPNIIYDWGDRLDD